MGGYRAFKKHDDWVESLTVVNTTVNGKTFEEIFSAGADGIVHRWQLDSEQNCDVYKCIVSMGTFRHMFSFSITSVNTA